MSRVKDRDKSKQQKKHLVRKNRNLRTYSFLATSTILLIIIALSYVSSLPKVEHIPSSFQPFSQSWMKYAPQSAHYVSYINYQEAYKISGDANLFGSEPLLQFYQLGFNMKPQDVIYEVDIQLAISETDVTVNLVKLQTQTSELLLNAARNSTKIMSWNYQGYTIYGVLMSNPKQPKLALGYFSIVDEYTVFCGDENRGKETIERLIDQYVSNSANLFDDSAVKKAVYTLGVEDQSLVSLFIGMFPAQLNDTQMIAKSILRDKDGILVTRSLMFPTTDIALSQYEQAHKIYRDASSYRVMDSYIVVTYRYTSDKLRSELLGI